jgi:hypothetical protein
MDDRRSSRCGSFPAAALLLLVSLLALAPSALAACGGVGERLCDLFADGRMGCDRGLADVLGKCQTPGLCGGEGQRLCYVFIDGRGGCNAELVDVKGSCARPDCGGLGQGACALVGRNSCNAGLVEVNNRCFTRGDCGGADQRACLIGERTGNSCNANLVERNGMCLRTNCGALGQSACAIVGRNSCDEGLVEVNNACFTRGDCGDIGQRACLIGERTGNSCDANLVERSGMCIATSNCGAVDQKACAEIGRNSCDDGLVEYKGTCRMRGDCGATNARPCLIGERPGNSCDAGLTEHEGICKACGAVGQMRCAVVGRNSCDDGLVEFNGTCARRADCGAAGQRACLVGERNGNSCDAGLMERSGKCLACGALGQAACAIVGRNSCDDGLVEFNDTCYTRGACGAADQRACLIGERKGNSCDENLFEKGGICYQCGAAGQRACAIVGRKSCDAGLVEFSNTCFPRGACGLAGQRVCLFGEGKIDACDKGLAERNGLCLSPGPRTSLRDRQPFVFVRTEPAAPFLLPGEAVTIVATAYDISRKNTIKARQIEILQSVYLGPGSVAPVLVHTCANTDTCRFELPRRKLSPAVSYMARVTTKGASVFESSIRITDLRFVAAPMRMNVAAEVTGRNRISEMPHHRAIDIVLYAGTGYEVQSTAGATVFSTRLGAELETMLGVAPKLERTSSLSEHLPAVNFYVAQAPGIVNHVSLFDMCEHSTAGPVPFGDAQGILHPELDCRDWSVPGPFYSAGTPSISWHEMHHAAFGLSDEYCKGTIHYQRARDPNVFNSQADCQRLSTDPANCMRIAEPPGCTDPNCECSTSYWRAGPTDDDVMINNLREQTDDLRAIDGKFEDCRLGRC